MFKLESAKIYYGVRGYEKKDEIPSDLQTVDSVDNISAERLTAIMGRLAGGYPREFTIKHVERQVYTKEEHGADLVIPESIHAMANGYGLVWRKV